MAGPKNIEEAKALPEVSRSELAKMGIGPEPLDGSSIAMFVDVDGVAKSVECAATAALGEGSPMSEEIDGN